MPRKSTSLLLKEGDYDYLRSLIKQRTIQAQVVIRAHILLDRYNGVPIRTIAQIYDLSPSTVQLCIKKYKNGGTDSALMMQLHGSLISPVKDRQTLDIHRNCGH